jgi:hypothetical protein
MITNKNPTDRHRQSDLHRDPVPIITQGTFSRQPFSPTLSFVWGAPARFAGLHPGFPPAKSSPCHPAEAQPSLHHAMLLRNGRKPTLDGFCTQLPPLSARIANVSN